MKGKDIWHLFEMAAQSLSYNDSVAHALMQIMYGQRKLDLKDQTDLKMWAGHLHQWHGLYCRTVENGGLDP